MLIILSAASVGCCKNKKEISDIGAAVKNDMETDGVHISIPAPGTSFKRLWVRAIIQVN